MISFKFALLALCFVFVQSENNVKSTICGDIVNIVNSLNKTLEDVHSWNLYDCASENKDTCVACEDMVFNIRYTFEESDKTEKFVSVCKNYGLETLTSQCDLINEQCLPEFIILLNSKMPSSAVCTSMGIAFSSTSITGLLNTKGKNEMRKICVDYVLDEKNMYTSKATRLGLLTQFKQFCDLTSGAVKTECVHYARKYYEYFYIMFIEKLDPKSLCDDSDLHQTQLQKKYQRKTLFNEELCFACEILVITTQKLLNNKHLAGEVKSAIKQICTLIPDKSKAKQCDQYVTEYTNFIVDLLAKEADPSLVCPMTVLCNVTKSERNNYTAMIEKDISNFISSQINITVSNLTSSSKQINITNIIHSVTSDIKHKIYTVITETFQSLWSEIKKNFQ